MRNIRTLKDDELVTLYSEGDNRAFDVLLDRYQQKLFSYIFFIVKDQDISDDIFQETFMKAIVTIKNGKYSENGRFYSWITRIAHNLIIDQFRNAKSENLVSCENEDYDLLNNQELCESYIEADIINLQIMDDIKKLVDNLPDNQKEIVMMRFYQDMSFKEIAEATGTSINTALGRMRYAILNLRKMVADNSITLSA